MVKLGLVVIALVMAAPAWAGMSDDEKCRTIRRDIQEYQATGHPCPCPYNLTRRGSMCGNLSAWAKPGGRAPRCYFGDVDGSIPPNQRPNPTRQNWPEPPPCNVLR
jgi:hypothetical protein